MKKSILILLTLFTILVHGCGEDNETPIISDPTSVLLPLYVYPTDWKDNSELTALINATDGQLISIINPNNGPGNSQNSDYVDGIDYLSSKDTKIIAYIYTSYGSRDKQEIYDDIDAYVDFYGTDKLTGIFFDEVSLNNDDNKTYIKDISNYAKDQNLSYITLNPGTTVEQSIVDENYYDLIVTYENPYDDYQNFTNPLKSSAKTKQSLLVYEYPDLDTYKDEIKKAKDMKFDYIYLTIDTSDNPWDSVFNFLK
jgi:hypothetical protein